LAYKDILLERRGAVALLTINRPERLNALSVETWREMAAALAQMAREEVRALIITGVGRGFCSGIDMAEILDPQRGPEKISTVFSIPARLVAFPKPIIAAVNGVAIGDGLALALLCDIRIASEFARFAAGFITRGLVTILGCTYLLPRAVGLGRALELMYTGDVIDAGEALQLGLVHKVVPHEGLMEEALSLAERIAKGPPLAISRAKKLAYLSQGPPVTEHIELEGRFQRVCMMSQDFQEGIRSFLEKREPLFRGR